MEKLFPTTIMQGSLPKADAWNRQLLREIETMAEEDTLGQKWSRENYRHGYTSYGSLSDLHFRTPVFSKFAEEMQSYALAFAKAQHWEMQGLELRLTALWMSIMPEHAYHTLHLHPHSVISGTYYVRTPPGSAALKLEDPRMAFYMNAPVSQKSSLYVEIAPRAGAFVLFESWLRHEVPPNRSRAPRVSLSFNYSLEPLEI